MGCPLTRERKQKKTPIFIFKSVRVCLRESVHLRECVNTEFDWEVKWGFEKASVSRAVRLRECPLVESWLYSIFQRYENKKEPPESNSQQLSFELAHKWSVT